MMNTKFVVLLLLSCLLFAAPQPVVDEETGDDLEPQPPIGPIEPEEGLTLTTFPEPIKPVTSTEAVKPVTSTATVIPTTSITLAPGAKSTVFELNGILYQNGRVYKPKPGQIMNRDDDDDDDDDDYEDDNDDIADELCDDLEDQFDDTDSELSTCTITNMMFTTENVTITAVLTFEREVDGTFITNNLGQIKEDFTLGPDTEVLPLRQPPIHSNGYQEFMVSGTVYKGDEPLAWNPEYLDDDSMQFNELELQLCSQMDNFIRSNPQFSGLYDSCELEMAAAIQGNTSATIELDFYRRISVDQVKELLANIKVVGTQPSFNGDLTITPDSDESSYTASNEVDLVMVINANGKPVPWQPELANPASVEAVSLKQTTCNAINVSLSTDRKMKNALQGCDATFTASAKPTAQRNRIARQNTVEQITQTAAKVTFDETKLVGTPLNLDKIVKVLRTNPPAGFSFSNIVASTPPSGSADRACVMQTMTLVAAALLMYVNL